MNQQSEEKQTSSETKGASCTTEEGKRIKIPGLIHQNTVVDQSIQYVRDRAAGNIEFLKTCYPSLDTVLAGGFEFNTMCTVSGLSGGGKSTLSKRLMTSIVHNVRLQGKECVCLSFNFEMVAHKTIGREIANRSRKSLRELYSSDKPIDDAMINYMIEEYYAQIRDYPVYYIEEPQTYEEIYYTILHYWTTLCKPENKGLIVEIDHAVIARGLKGDSRGDKIDKLTEHINMAKKKIASVGGRVFFIMLSQMNRDIRSTERRMYPAMHAPMTSDLFGASSIEFFSDYIIVIHIPAKLHLQSYTEQQLPVWLGDRDTEFVYWHILKQRDGPPDRVLPFLNDLEFFDFKSLSREEFQILWDQFKKLNKCFLSEAT